MLKIEPVYCAKCEKQIGWEMKKNRKVEYKLFIPDEPENYDYDLSDESQWCEDCKNWFCDDCVSEFYNYIDYDYFQCEDCYTKSHKQLCYMCDMCLDEDECLEKDLFKVCDLYLKCDNCNFQEECDEWKDKIYGDIAFRDMCIDSYGSEEAFWECNGI